MSQPQSLYARRNAPQEMSQTEAKRKPVEYKILEAQKSGKRLFMGLRSVRCDETIDGVLCMCIYCHRFTILVCACRCLCCVSVAAIFADLSRQSYDIDPLVVNEWAAKHRAMDMEAIIKHQHYDPKVGDPKVLQPHLVFQYGPLPNAPDPEVDQNSLMRGALKMRGHPIPDDPESNTEAKLWKRGAKGQNIVDAMAKAYQRSVIDQAIWEDENEFEHTVQKEEVQAR
jgi:hypothetical protein